MRNIGAGSAAGWRPHRAQRWRRQCDLSFRRRGARPCSVAAVRCQSAAARRRDRSPTSENSQRRYLRIHRCRPRCPAIRRRYAAVLRQSAQSSPGTRCRYRTMRRTALRRQETSLLSSAPTIPVPRRGRSSVPACAKTRCHLRYWTFKEWIRLQNSIAFECNDAGYLYHLAHLVEGGFVKVPWLVPTILGILRGVGSDTSIFVRSAAVDCDRTYADPV